MRFSAEEWDAMVANEENLTLVGRFVKEIPHLDTIRRTIYASLHLEGGVQVASLNRRTILLRFDLEFDCRKIWLRRAMLEGARIVSEKGGWERLWQSIESKKLPTYCAKCGRNGHLVGDEDSGRRPPEC
nr:TMV resistance protein N-like [Ipomoea batatas]